MAGIREIKLRIKSIKETRHITKAMKLISASKLKKARQMLESARPYFDKVKQTMAEILAHSENVASPYFETREKEDRKVGFIALTGDKGLAGGYNHNILDLVRKLAAENRNYRLFVAGHLGKVILSREGYDIDGEFDYPVMNPSVYRAREIGEYVLGLFDKGELDEVHLVFTRMVTSLSLEPTTIKLLPLDLKALLETLKNENAPAAIQTDSDLQYEPSVSAVLHVLIPKYMNGIVYGALVEAYTSEQSSRMTAMDNATANADEILQSLNLFFNRARQASITQEISEVVGGAAALQRT